MEVREMERKFSQLEHDVRDHGILRTIAETQRDHGRRLDGIDARLDGMDARFDGIDARFDGMDARFDGIDARLDGMDAKFDTVIDLLRDRPAGAGS
jgi:hypothetical protein